MLAPRRALALLLFAALTLTAVLVWRAHERTTVIAVVPETTAQEIWESEHAGAEHEARTRGWSIYWNAPSREDDFPRQIQIVEQSIARKVDGLVLAPDHAIALISPVRTALAHHIPTVIVGSPLGIAPGDGLRYVLNDDRAMGTMAAQRASRLLADDESVVVLGVNASLIASVERANAFETELHRARPKIGIQEHPIGAASYAEAEETTENAIRADQRLHVIFALNVNQARAAFAALQATGQVGRIALIVCDQDLDLLHHLRTGGIDTILAQNTRQMGAQAIAAIDALRNNREVPLRQIVEPVLVTPENVDTDAIQQVLNMDWRAGA